MITLFIKIVATESKQVLEWFKIQKIYVSTKDWYDWKDNGKHYVMIGMTVTEKQAELIKLQYTPIRQGKYGQI